MHATPRPRLAVAMILHRGGLDGEIFLARRQPSMRFFGGFHAFPGGAVTDADRGEDAAPVLRSEGIPSHLALALAREALEELALDLASGELDLNERESWRSRVRAEPEAYVRGLRRQGRRVDCSAWRYGLRLVTPDFYPLRFDTHFFLIDLDQLQRSFEFDLHEDELDQAAWGRPSDWLERWRRGALLIAPPVLSILEALGQAGLRGAPEALSELARDLELGRPERFLHDPAVRLIPLRTPTLPPARHTNCCLIGHDPAYVVDPATPETEEQELLHRHLEDAVSGGARLQAVLLTHHHADHVGAVTAVQERWRLPIWAHATTAQLVARRFTVDRRLEDGETLELGRSPDGRPNWELEVLFTPGHAMGHLCFFERRYGSLVAGDMISTLSSILVHPDDGDMALYLQSLLRLASLPSRVVVPAHGPPTAAGAAVFETQIAHRQARESAVLRAVRDGVGDLEGILDRVYSDVPSFMHDHARASLQSILRMLHERGELRVFGDRIQAR